jgi:D-alanine-D-alanine ligase
MAKINRHIKIVRSSAAGLSSMSIKSSDAILAVLSKHYTRVGVTTVNNLSDLEALVADKPDLVFLGMKFIPKNHALGLQDPDKIWIAKYLDEHGIAYTGSNQTAHRLELNKPLAKQRVLDVGLNTSPFYVAKQNQPTAEDNMPLSFPLFIKPTSRGGGEGIDSDSVVSNFAEMESKILSIAAELQSDSLVEEYLPGREFSVAILKEERSEAFLVMPIEKIAALDRYGQRVFSQQIKSTDSVRDLLVTDKVIKSRVATLAINAFHALGARDYGRIDIRLDKNGTPQFLEANLIPSIIGGYGSFPKSCVLNMNLGYEPMILHIVRLGVARNPEDAPQPNALGLVTLPALIGQAV